MFMLKKKYLSVALLAVAAAVISASCSNAGNQPKNSDSSVNISPTAGETDKPQESAPTEEPEATVLPTPAVTEEAAASPAPTESAAAAKPAATGKPSIETYEKPEATVKPTKKPVASPKPSPTAEPTKKPASATAAPTVKPSVKPTATPKPSPLTMATPSPTPKPTTMPDPENPSAEFTVADIAAKLTADAGLGPLKPVEGDQIKETYGIDTEKQLVDGIFYQPKMVIQAGEFSVVQLKTDQDYEDVKEAFEKRAETVKKTFESYLEDQYEQAQNYQIIRNGNFVLFSITPDQKKAAEIFNGFFKKE